LEIDIEVEKEEKQEEEEDGTLVTHGTLLGTAA
jgi:hypothetical protein